MVVRLVSLLLSAWVLLSAYALPRLEVEIAAYASMGVFCVIAELVTLALPSFQYANGVNAALLLAWALYFPGSSAITTQNDIITSGLLLIFSCGFPARPPSPSRRSPQAEPRLGGQLPVGESLHRPPPPPRGPGSAHAAAATPIAISHAPLAPPSLTQPPFRNSGIG